MFTKRPPVFHWQFSNCCRTVLFYSTNTSYQEQVIIFLCRLRKGHPCFYGVTTALHFTLISTGINIQRQRLVRESFNAAPGLLASAAPTLQQPSLPFSGYRWILELFLRILQLCWGTRCPLCLCFTEDVSPQQGWFYWRFWNLEFLWKHWFLSYFLLNSDFHYRDLLYKLFIL